MNSSAKPNEAFLWRSYRSKLLTSSKHKLEEQMVQLQLEFAPELTQAIIIEPSQTRMISYAKTKLRPEEFIQELLSQYEIHVIKLYCLEPNKEVDFNEFSRVLLEQLFPILKSLIKNHKKIPLYILAQTQPSTLAQLFNQVLIGLCKTIWQEHPQYECGFLEGDSELSKLPNCIPFQQSPLLYYQKGEFYHDVLEPVSLTHSNRSIKFDPKACYIITGGTGGIGQAWIQYLLEQGAQNILSLSRNITSPHKIETPYVHYHSLDLTDAKAVQQFFNELKQKRTPIKGIFHTAGVLADELMVDMTQAQFEKVWSTKALSAWLIHENTLDLKLDYFILFSSISALFGNFKQANYVAANSFLDGLARLRREMGLAGMSIQWGPWDNVGMTGRQLNYAQYFRTAGITALKPEYVFSQLADVFQIQEPVILIAQITWDTFKKINLHPCWPHCLIRNLTKQVISENQNSKQVSLELDYTTQALPKYSPASHQQIETYGLVESSQEKQAYVIAAAFLVEGILNKNKIEQLLKTKLERYDLFSASFIKTNDQISLKYHEKVLFTYQIGKVAELHEWMKQQYKIPFDLEKPCLFRFAYLINDQGHSYLWFLFHHLIVDGFSMIRFVQNFLEDYGAADCRQSHLKPYKDYIEWQWSYYKSEIFYQEFQYFKDKKIVCLLDENVKLQSEVDSEVIEKAISGNLFEKINQLYKMKIIASHFFLACVAKTLAELYQTDAVSLIMLLASRNADYIETLGDTSNDSLLTLDHLNQENIYLLVENISQKVNDLVAHPNIRLGFFAEQGYKIPKISFDYQVFEPHHFMMDGLKTTLISVPKEKNYLWGIDPHYLSFKFHLQAEFIEYSLEYRKDKITYQMAQAIFDLCLDHIKKYANFIFPDKDV